MTLINWDILKSPMNWVVVILMLIIAGIAGHLLLTWAGVEAATASDNNN